MPKIWFLPQCGTRIITKTTISNLNNVIIKRPVRIWTSNLNNLINKRPVRIWTSKKNKNEYKSTLHCLFWIYVLCKYLKCWSIRIILNWFQKNWYTTVRLEYKMKQFTITYVSIFNWYQMYKDIDEIYRAGRWGPLSFDERIKSLTIYNYLFS